MLGTINGAYLTRFAVNANRVAGLAFGDLNITQADATISAAGVSALNGAATYTEAAHVMAAAAVNALAAACAFTHAAHTLSGAGAAAVGSSLTTTNDTHGISGISTGAIEALLSAIAAGDTLESVAETGPIKALLDFIQQAQTLSAAGTVLGGASLNALMANQVGAGSGTLAIAGAGAIQELDDLLAAAFKQILTRTALGADVLPHASGNRLTPHGRGNSVTVH